MRTITLLEAIAVAVLFFILGALFGVSVTVAGVREDCQAMGSYRIKQTVIDCSIREKAND